MNVPFGLMCCFIVFCVFGKYLKVVSKWDKVFHNGKIRMYESFILLNGILNKG